MTFCVQRYRMRLCFAMCAVVVFCYVLLCSCHVLLCSVMCPVVTIRYVVMFCCYVLLCLATSAVVRFLLCVSVRHTHSNNVTKT